MKLKNNGKNLLKDRKQDIWHKKEKKEDYAFLTSPHGMDT